MAPLFSRELRKIRGKLKSSELADVCGVTTETIRQIEKGARPPSQKVLLAWFAHFGIDPQSRKDILESVNQKRVKENGRIREFVATQHLIGRESNISKEVLHEELLAFFGQFIELTDDTVTYPSYRLREIIDKHL